MEFLARVNKNKKNNREIIHKNVIVITQLFFVIIAKAYIYFQVIKCN